MYIIIGGLTVLNLSITYIISLKKLIKYMKSKYCKQPRKQSTSLTTHMNIALASGPQSESISQSYYPQLQRNTTIRNKHIVRKRRMAMIKVKGLSNISSINLSEVPSRPSMSSSVVSTIKLP